MSEILLTLESTMEVRMTWLCFQSSAIVTGYIKLFQPDSKSLTSPVV